MILYRAWWFFFSYKKGQTKYFRLYGPYDLYCNYTTSKLMHTYKILNLYYNVLCFVTQLCLTLCNPRACSLLGSSVHGIRQARILEWVATPFSRGSSPPRDQIQVSTTSANWEAHKTTGTQIYTKPKQMSISGYWFYLSKFEFHIIFRCHELLFFFWFFKSFLKIKSHF